MTEKKSWTQWAWDTWCILSIIGIWPRFIEPKCITLNNVDIKIPSLPPALNGLKILQFSDLHWSSKKTKKHIDKLIKKINRTNPDLIVFTGDFLIRSELEKSNELKDLLCSLKAKYGMFAVLGNHDYQDYVTVNEKGDYDTQSISKKSDLLLGFKRLFSRVKLTKHITARAQSVNLHKDLIKLIKETPFTLLHNESLQINCNGHTLNICGIGEYTAGKADLEQAFENYNGEHAGIILAHNPDLIEKLEKYPGDLILSGHTHGGQINLPFLWKKFTFLENFNFKRGLKRYFSKWAYINRGVGHVMNFRWFSVPELTLLTLVK